MCLSCSYHLISSLLRDFSGWQSILGRALALVILCHGLVGSQDQHAADRLQ